MPRHRRDQQLARYVGPSDRGFSLTEILVVIVIIGMLAAIAVPLFLNQRQKAFRAVVQSDLRNAANAIEGAATGQAGDYLATGLPTDTPLGPDTVIVGLGLMSGGGRGTATSVSTAATVTLTYSASPKVTLWIETLTRTSYCMNAKHASMSKMWSFDSTRGTSVEGGCSSSSALPGTTTAAPEETAGGPSQELPGGGCDPKDTKCQDDLDAEKYGCKIGDQDCLTKAREEAAIAEAEKYGCKVGDTDCINEGRQKDAAAEAEKYGCKVGDNDCLIAAKDKEAEALGCRVGDAQCLADAKAKQAALTKEQDAALAQKYGCKVTDDACMTKARASEASGG